MSTSRLARLSRLRDAPSGTIMSLKSARYAPPAYPVTASYRSLSPELPRGLPECTLHDRATWLLRVRTTEKSGHIAAGRLRRVGSSGASHWLRQPREVNGRLHALIRNPLVQRAQQTQSTESVTDT